MSRPEVTIDNFPAVFNYYDGRGPSPAFARFGHWAMGQAFKPQIEIDAQDSQTIHDSLNNGALAFLLMSHDSDRDQYSLAATVQRLPALHAIRGNAVIMARYDLFCVPGMTGKAQRRAIDALGSFPAYRAKDVEGGDDTRERRMQRLASASTIQLGINKTDRDGYHIAGFPQGERTKKGQDRTKINKISHGFGEIYSNIAPQKEVIIITMGEYDGEDDARDYKNSTMAIGEPITSRLSTPQEFTEMVHANLQRDLTRAVELRQSA